MEWLYVIAIVIILVILTILLVIFMPKPKSFFNAIDICKELILLSEEKYFEKIKEEIVEFEKNNTNADTDIDIKLFYKNMLDMKFRDLPQTYELFRTIPNLRSVTLTTLKAKTETPIHKGNPEDVNDTISCILPIRLSGAKKNTLWCDGESKFFDLGTWILYDASREHSFNNKHKKLTTLYLLITVDRPNFIPKGIA